MKHVIGLVCPYSFDAPGGVQYHVRDLATELQARGHRVSVLAPAESSVGLPDYFVSAGKAMAVRYNGSVARLSFGPATARRVGHWLAEGDFDLIHVHEPAAPSVGMLAMWQAQVPIVATFHSAQIRSRAMQVAAPVLRSMLEKITARIAVSEDARRTLIDHLGGDAVIIPNGVDTAVFAAARPDERWTATLQAPIICFLGRLDEPRKGLAVFIASVGKILEAVPGARFVVAGQGDEGKAAAIEQLVGAGIDPGRVEFIGRITDGEKCALFSGGAIYVAPQTGGESFGIVLVEAMAAGALVVASNLGAFERVLDHGNAGMLFVNGDGADLARVCIQALADRAASQAITSHAQVWAGRFDWKHVTTQIENVYDIAVGEKK